MKGYFSRFINEDWIRDKLKMSLARFLSNDSEALKPSSIERSNSYDR